MKVQKIYIFISAIIFGFLLIIQTRSYESVNELFSRDMSSNIFQEIKKHEKLNGKSPIYGPGLRIEINADISSQWLVDFINELFNSTAQAVSINSIRITNQIGRAHV